MAKYIDAEKLIHDLEERIFAYSEGYAEGDDCRKDAIETLLKDVRYQCSLQQEQQEVDLKKELDKFYGMYRKDGKTYDITDDEEVSDWKEDGNSWFKIEFARHFYNLGLNVRKEENK